MGVKRFFGLILDLLFPPMCEVCSCSVGHGEKVCKNCIDKFRIEMFYHCPECGCTADKCTCEKLSDPVWKTNIGGRNSFSLTFYLSVNDRDEGRITEKMMFALKERNVLFDFFAETVSSSLRRLFDSAGEDITEWIFTFPPRSEKNYDEYGYDQCEEIVKRMAALVGAEWAYTLKRVGGGEQKNMNTAERAKNATDTVVLIRENVVSGGKYIVFDDILTTGATMNAAARNLLFAGASEVFPVTIAKTLHTRKGKNHDSKTY